MHGCTSLQCLLMENYNDSVDTSNCRAAAKDIQQSPGGLRRRRWRRWQAEGTHLADMAPHPALPWGQELSMCLFCSTAFMSAPKTQEPGCHSDPLQCVPRLSPIGLALQARQGSVQQRAAYSEGNHKTLCKGSTYESIDRVI